MTTTIVSTTLIYHIIKVGFVILFYLLASWAYFFQWKKNKDKTKPWDKVFFVSLVYFLLIVHGECTPLFKGWKYFNITQHFTFQCVLVINGSIFLLLLLAVGYHFYKIKSKANKK